MSEHRTCKVCSATLPLDRFYMKDTTAGRLDTHCKPCRDQKNREYRERNRHKVRKQSREWYAKNSERIAEGRREKQKHLSDEQIARRREQQERAELAYAERNRQAYLEEHGGAPLCECGCGREVRFDSKGRPNRYIQHHQPVNWTVIHRRREIEGFVPIDKFRGAVQKLRRDRGWTVSELAERGGLSYSHMHALLYDKRKNAVYGLDKGWVRDFLLRLAGAGAPPTTYQLKQHAKSEEREYRLDI